MRSSPSSLRKSICHSPARGEALKALVEHAPSRARCPEFRSQALNLGCLELVWVELRRPWRVGVVSRSAQIRMPAMEFRSRRRVTAKSCRSPTTGMEQLNSHFQPRNRTRLPAAASSRAWARWRRWRDGAMQARVTGTLQSYKAALRHLSPGCVRVQILTKGGGRYAPDSNCGRGR